MTSPATRFVHSGVEIEDIFKVVQTEHFLIERIKLDTALKVRQSQRSRRLKDKENKDKEVSTSGCVLDVHEYSDSHHD